MPRTLHIAKPCFESWEAMTGTDQQRHCAHCDKHVIALSELSPDEAALLLHDAAPRSLCLRVEHDDDGAVLFHHQAKPSPKPGAPGHSFRLAVGASLLLAACAKTEPAPSGTTDSPITAVQEPSHAQVPTAPTAAPPLAPSPPESAEIGSQAKRSGHVGHTDGEHGTTLVDKKNGQRVTMGCICAPNDPLCSCL